MSETTVGWAKRVYELYAQGAGDAEVAADLKITLKEFYKQMQDNEKFATLVEFGRTLSQAWWESQFRQNLKTKGFNTSALTFYMKNKFGWADKIESSSMNENLNTNLDDLRSRISAELMKFVEKNTPELTDAKRVLEGLGNDNRS